MSRRNRPVLHRQPHTRTAPRPTCCVPCVQLYDRVYADCARMALPCDPGKVYSAIQERRPCLLCGDATISWASMFLPQHNLTPRGAIVYFLCADCLSLPAEARACYGLKAAIMAGLVGRRN